VQRLTVLIIVVKVLVNVVTVLVVILCDKLVKVIVARVVSLNVSVVDDDIVIESLDSTIITVLVLVVRNVDEIVVTVNNMLVLVVVVVVAKETVNRLVIVKVKVSVTEIIDADVEVITIDDVIMKDGEIAQKRPCKLELQFIKVETNAPASPLDAKTAGQLVVPGPITKTGPLTNTPKGLFRVGENIANSTFNAFVTNANCNADVNDGGKALLVQKREQKFVAVVNISNPCINPEFIVGAGAERYENNTP
jgi:hypothetical protein